LIAHAAILLVVMKEENQPNRAQPTIADLYTNLNEEEAREVEENLERYVELTLWILEHSCPK
jgi:hypothetical protein